jgi:RimJ/RimL family protein N-acetyltransferase
MRIYLRGLNSCDADYLYNWFLDPEIQNLTSGNSFYPSVEYVKRWIEDKIFNPKDIYLGICLVETNEIIGYLSVNNIDYRNRKAEWGGLVIGNKKFWGSGYATESAGLMLRYVFDELNINLFWAFWLEEHSSSIRMGEKLGFKKVGVIPQSVFKQGKYHNQLIMYITRKDYLGE